MASRAPLRLNHRCPVWFHSCRLRVEGKAFRPPFSCAKKPEADDKTVTIPLRAHEIWLPSEVRSRPLRLIPPSPPANLPPCIPHELRTTQGRRSPACPPRRATPHRRAALSAAVTGHRSRPASAAVPGLSAPSAQTDRISAKQPRKRGCFCDRFVLSLQKTDGTSAKQPRTRGCFCPRFVLSLRRIRSFFVSV